MAGFSLAGLAGYGFVLWMPSFFVRSYGLSPTEVGLTLAVMIGVVGGLGTFVAGRMTDLLAHRDVRWRAWIVTVGMATHVPFMVAFFLIDDLWPALALFVIPAFFSGFYLAPTFALVQGLVGLRMRALASSITLFSVNIIGLGLGPQLVGIMSDWFAPEYGQESLRMALLVLTFFKLWSAFHYYLAARTLPTDLKAIEVGQKLAGSAK